MLQLLTKNRIIHRTVNRNWSAWRCFWTAPDIRSRFLVTFGLLALYRFCANIPGVRPGTATENYLRHVQRRITLVGALFLGIVAILPWILSLLSPIGANTDLLLVSSSGLLIVVGVVRDVYYNLEAELKVHGYDRPLLVH